MFTVDYPDFEPNLLQPHRKIEYCAVIELVSSSVIYISHFILSTGIM